MRSPRNIFTFYDPVTKIWRGTQTPPLFNPNQSLGELLLAVLDLTPNQVTQISADSGVQVTCSEMRLRTIRIAQNLVQLGYKRGDIFAMAVRNGEHAASTLMACFALGIPVNTLDATFQRDDFSHMLGTVRPKLVFCDQESLQEMEVAMKMVGSGAEVVVFGEKVSRLRHIVELLEPTGIEEDFVPVHFEDASTELAVVLCSSGTTGRSKGVCLSHSACIASICGLTTCYSSDIMLCFSSLYWYSGVAIMLLGTMIGAKRIITRDVFSPELALDLIERYRVTFTFFSPATAYRMVKHPRVPETDLSSLRYCLCGGAQVSADLKHSFESLAPNAKLNALYGLSEAAGAVTFSLNDTYKQGSTGYVKPNCELKIVDDNGRALDVNQEGEIIVKSHMCTFMGYYGNREATSEILESDGWMHTGDIGRVDEDGLLFVVDRKKDIIKYNGYQISPTELENTISTIPGVVLVCVTGIPVPSNELLAALIVKREDATDLDEEKVHRVIESRLGSYKKLRGGVYFTKELPMTPSGKVLRRVCREMLIERYNNTTGLGKEE